MTIKQTGGIFGRNPTFNDLTVEGVVSVPNDSLSGDAIDGGDASVDSLNVDGAVTTDAGSTFDAGTNFVADNSASNKSLVLASSGATPGNGQYGASVAFSRINTTSPRAAIAAVETDNNFERMGLAFFTHISNNGSDPMNRRMAIKHDGDVVMYNIDSTTESFRWDCSDNALRLGGNVILGSGNGIDFSATSGTGTSELFDDYEEGTWTPTGFNVGSTGITAGGSASYSGVYTKVGRFVNCRIDIDVDDAGTSASVGDLIYFSSGLPFTPDASLVTGAGNAVIYNSIGSNALGMVQVFLSSNTVYMKVIQTSGTVNYGQTIRGNFSYSVGG